MGILETLTYFVLSLSRLPLGFPLFSTARHSSSRAGLSVTSRYDSVFGLRDCEQQNHATSLTNLVLKGGRRRSLRAEGGRRPARRGRRGRGRPAVVVRDGGRRRSGLVPRGHHLLGRRFIIGQKVA